MSTIGLSMIIKDEPLDRLAMLVQSLEPVIDEIIFIDTGSLSYESESKIWQSWGVKHYQFKWCDDFSAARNYSLDKMSSDWILQMDGDEIPSASMIATLSDVKSSLLNDNIVGILFHRVQFFGGVKLQEVQSDWHCRLFRNKRGVWYRKVHELVALDGQPEHITRGTIKLVAAPKHSYIIHSKPGDRIKSSSELYEKIERESSNAI